MLDAHADDDVDADVDADDDADVDADDDADVDAYDEPVTRCVSTLCAVQELCELAQRKFLRQVVLYAELQDMLPYPRLFLVDFAKVEGETGVCLA